MSAPYRESALPSEIPVSPIAVERTLDQKISRASLPYAASGAIGAGLLGWATQPIFGAIFFSAIAARLYFRARAHRQTIRYVRDLMRRPECFAYQDPNHGWLVISPRGLFLEKPRFQLDVEAVPTASEQKDVAFHAPGTFEFLIRSPQKGHIRGHSFSVILPPELHHRASELATRLGLADYTTT